MSENNAAPVEQGASGGANDPANPPAPPKDDVVPYDKYRGLLDEKKKAQKRAEEAEAKLNQIEEDKLKAAGDLQKLIDAEKERSKVLSEKVSTFEAERTNARKMHAFLKAAGSNLDDKWLDIVQYNHLNQIGVKEGTDEVDPMSVMAQVENFKKQWPEAFKAPGAMPPATPPNGQGGKISRSDFAKLSAKDMKKYKAADILD